MIIDKTLFFPFLNRAIEILINSGKRGENVVLL